MCVAKNFIIHPIGKEGVIYYMYKIKLEVQKNKVWKSRSTFQLRYDLWKNTVNVIMFT